MLSNDFLVTFLLMAILFLRQVSILKQPNKINYAPLMLGIGAISSVIHFIIHPESKDILLILRESLFPFLVALLLFIIMNILHQTQQSENARTQHEFTKSLISQITQLKDFMSNLENRMNSFAQDDRHAQDEMRDKFKQDIKALEAIQTNQKNFFYKFEELNMWQKNVSNMFEDFTNVKLPEFDNVIHKHIDIFRVSEQDHFNQIKQIVQKAVQSKDEINEDVEELLEKMQEMKQLSTQIANSIVKHTLEQLSGVSKDFEQQMLSLKSHSESVKTSLYESENRLSDIKTQSEMIMKQMVLSSKKMQELEDQNRSLNDMYTTIKELMAEIEIIKKDYVKSQSQLSSIAEEFREKENEQIEQMQQQIDALGTTLTKNIDESLTKLHEHYHIADEDITKSVQILAKKAQLQKGYNS